MGISAMAEGNRGRWYRLPACTKRPAIRGRAALGDLDAALPAPADAPKPATPPAPLGPSNFAFHDTPAQKRGRHSGRTEDGSPRNRGRSKRVQSGLSRVSSQRGRGHHSKATIPSCATKVDERSSRRHSRSLPGMPPRKRGAGIHSAPPGCPLEDCGHDGCRSDRSVHWEQAPPE